MFKKLLFVLALSLLATIAVGCERTPQEVTVTLSSDTEDAQLTVTPS